MSVVKPDVSVVVPCYNQAHFLCELLDSVAIATTRHHEVIIVNDGSTKSSTERYLAGLKAVAPHQELTVLHKANGGLSSARNFGVSRSKAAFVQFLDADDMLWPDSIDFRYNALITHNLDVAICDYTFCNLERNKFWNHDKSTITQDNLNFFGVAHFWERGLTIPIHCGLFRKSLLDSPPFHAGLRGKEDWIFWLGLFLASSKVKYFPHVGAVYRMHDQNMTRDGRSMAISWLRAIEIAKSKFPCFDDVCIGAALKHFKQYYLHYFWAETGGHFPIAFYERLLWQGCDD